MDGLKFLLSLLGIIISTSLTASGFVFPRQRFLPHHGQRLTQYRYGQARHSQPFHDFGPIFQHDYFPSHFQRYFHTRGWLPPLRIRQRGPVYGPRFHTRFPVNRISPFYGRRSRDHMFVQQPQRFGRMSSSFAWSQILNPPSFVRQSIRFPGRRSGSLFGTRRMPKRFLTAPRDVRDQRLFHIVRQTRLFPEVESRLLDVLPVRQTMLEPQAIIGWTDDDDQNLQVSVSSGDSGVRILAGDSNFNAGIGDAIAFQGHETIAAETKVTSAAGKGKTSGVLGTDLGKVVAKAVAATKDVVAGGKEAVKLSSKEDQKKVVKKGSFTKDELPLPKGGKIIGDSKIKAVSESLAKGILPVHKDGKVIADTKLKSSIEAGVLAASGVIIGDGIGKADSKGILGDIVDTAKTVAVVKDADKIKDTKINPKTKLAANIQDADTVNIAVNSKSSTKFVQKAAATTNEILAPVDGGKVVKETVIAPIVDKVLAGKENVILDSVAITKKDAVIKPKIAPVKGIVPKTAPVKKVEPAIVPVKKPAPKILPLKGEPKIAPVKV